MPTLIGQAEASASTTKPNIKKRKGKKKALRRRRSTGSNAIQKEQCPPDSTGRISATLLRAASAKQ